MFVLLTDSTSPREQDLCPTYPRRLERCVSDCPRLHALDRDAGLDWSLTPNISAPKIAQHSLIQGISAEVGEPSSGIAFCISTAYEGMYLESYYLNIQVQHPRKIVRHSIPAFIPLEQMARTYLQQDLRRFLDVLCDALNAYVSRRYQAEQLQERHTAYLTGQVQRNFAYNLLKFQYSIRCGDTEQDVQVKLVYGDLDCCLPTGIVLACTGADAEPMKTKLECHRQLFQNMELHRAFDSLKLKEEVVVSSSSLSAAHSSATPSC
ncbi:centromere protein O isoform X2 [Heterodontus francisci]|uniref:centromere protein O isoform X2 n=1 Tax=Heterodontus francisci TaxID=7792 RepID=UPI00355B4BF6